MAEVWLNGSFVQEDAARIDPRDGGFLHGVGVFTTLLSRDGRPVMVDAHLKRLRTSCDVLYVPMKFSDDTIRDALDELLERNNLRDARIRLTATRGVSTQDPLHGEVHRPTLLATAAPLTPYPPEFYERGMTVLLNTEQKANPYDLQAGHKTLDYFSRFAALREAARRGAGESLWFDVHNQLCSGCVCNVFWVEAGRVLTPPTNQELADERVRAAVPYPRSAVLPGTVRNLVLREADGAIASCDVNRLLAADEVFLTNSVMGVMPVTRLEAKEVADGKPGPRTREVAALVKERT
jgi:branched-chain amino acid aminotransferase